MRTLIILVFVTNTAGAQWFRENSGTTERLRAVSVVNDSVAWASGNYGTCLRTVDSGKTWIAFKIPQADSLDFRDVEAFDENTAYLLSIGPGQSSRIYKTTSGGSQWTLQFMAHDQKVFLDEFAFWDSFHGIAVGDGIDGHLYFLRTADGGGHWDAIPNTKIPRALPGEGAFAASGSGITVSGDSNIWVGTGVNTARVFRSTDRGDTWRVAETPIANGNESSGIFSVAFWDAHTGIIVGGDYRQEADSRKNIALTTDGGGTWKSAVQPPPAGFRSAVVYLTENYLVTVGPSGTDFSTDGGKSWKKIDSIGYHAVGRARNGSAIWAVGEKGRIGHYVDLIVR